MNFQKHYFTEEEQINEILGIKNWKDLDPRNITNIFRKMGGSTKRKIQPRSYETTEVSQKGFQNLFGKLTIDYNDTSRKKKKIFIKDLFEGKFKEESAPDVFEDFQEVESTAVFRLNNGGAVILYHIIDEDNDDRFFVGIDGAGQKYFAAKKKDGGLGMIFKSWLSAQKAGNVWNLSNVAKGDVKKKQSAMKKKIEIDDRKYDELTPEANKIRQLVASNQSFNLFDLFNEEVLSERKNKKLEYLMFKNGIFYKADIDGGKAKIVDDENGDPIEVEKFDTDKYEYQVLNKDGTEHKKGMEELNKELGKTEPKDNKEEKPNEESPKEDDTPSNEEEEAYGKLYYDIKSDLKNEPAPIKSKNVKQGWRYWANNNGVIFVYQSKTNNKYYIAYDEKGEQIVKKYDLINKYDLEKTIDTPE